MIVTVAIIEREQVMFSTQDVGSDVSFVAESNWSPTEFWSDSKGTRFAEELSRRLLSFWKTNNITNEYTLISLPGTILNSKTLKSSSRIGILEQIELADIVADKTKVKCLLFHDIESMSKGELYYGDYSEFDKTKCCIYIMVDEGIGAKIIMNGQFYNGSGTAGSISRMIIKEGGKHHKNFKSHGVLEAYVSRPMISKSIVDAFENFQTRIVEDSESNSTKFIKAVKVANETENRYALTYEKINLGITSKHQFVIDIIDEATRRLGHAIHILITVLNPEMIIIGGKMISEIESFYDKSIQHAHKLTWDAAWKTTKIYRSKDSVEHQVLGTIHLFQEIKNK